MKIDSYYLYSGRKGPDNARLIIISPNSVHYSLNTFVSLTLHLRSACTLCSLSFTRSRILSHSGYHSALHLIPLHSVLINHCSFLCSSLILRSLHLVFAIAIRSYAIRLCISLSLSFSYTSLACHYKPLQHFA